jgi:uncharacterized membrane protein
MNPEQSESLQSDLNELRGRVWRLEEALREYGIVVAAAPQGPVASAAPPPPVPLVQQQGLPTADALPASAPPMRPMEMSFSAFRTESTTTDEGGSLESRIGSQWFNRIGIVAVLIGMAWFLKLAIDNHWIGPAGRVLIGLAAGVGLIAWSERFRQHGYAAFSYSLKAVGSGTLYISLWAAFQLYHLLPAPAAFAAMVAVTAFNGFMAWSQDSELLALYAIAGCLSTPLLVSTGENHEITLFSYLLVMDLAVLALVALKPWSRLLAVTFAGTQLFVIAWWSEYYNTDQTGRTAFFAFCFFLIFALAPRLILLNAEENRRDSGWDTLAEHVLPILNAAAGFLTFYSLADTASARWIQPWIAITMALFYLLLVRMPARGWLRSSTPLLASLHLSTAIVLLTIAIPLKAHGRWLTVGWLVEAAALLWVARRNRSALLQVLAVGCLGLGLAALITGNPAAVVIPFFNQRFATYAVAIAVCAFTAWLSWQAHQNNEPSSALPWAGLALGAALTVSVLILVAVGLEIDAFWWQLRWQGDPNQLLSYQMYAQFTYSAWFMLYGAALLALGIGRKSALLRWQALVLLAVAIAKVFLVDTSELSQGLRILSFLGLGALLLGVSFVYQRDYLHLRTPEQNESAE